MKFLKKYSFLIGILLFVFILSKLDFSYYKELRPQIDFFKFILAVLLVLFFGFVRALRWRFLMRKQGINYSVYESYLMYLSSVYIGMFTPGRLGEASRVLYLTKAGYSIGKSFVSVVLDRLADIFFLLIFGYFSMFLFLQILKSEIFYIGLILALIVLLIFLVFKNQIIRAFLKKVFYFFIPPKYKDYWQLNSQEFLNELQVYRTKEYAWIFALTLLGWLTYYLIVYLLALSVGLNIVPFIYIASIVTLSSFLTLLPISVAGLGTRELVFISLLSVFAVSKELAVALSLLVFLMSVFVALIGLFCFLKKPLFNQ
ncbi:MAG: flippase-like domain-containing protein [Candidatus Zambryskibacteria bacterium]|nr:flippase-like domain-containing protein [Candidatus Zambryskibacteria bacterium]